MIPQYKLFSHLNEDLKKGDGVANLSGCSIVADTEGCTMLDNCVYYDGIKTSVALSFQKPSCVRIETTSSKGVRTLYISNLKTSVYVDGEIVHRKHFDARVCVKRISEVVADLCGELNSEWTEDGFLRYPAWWFGLLLKKLHYVRDEIRRLGTIDSSEFCKNKLSTKGERHETNCY